MKKLLAILLVLVFAVSFTFATARQTATGTTTIGAFIKDVPITVNPGVNGGNFFLGCFAQGVVDQTSFTTCDENSTPVVSAVTWTIHGGNGWKVNVMMTEPTTSNTHSDFWLTGMTVNGANQTLPMDPATKGTPFPLAGNPFQLDASGNATIVIAITKVSTLSTANYGTKTIDLTYLVSYN